jgi:hypothetical protein
MNSTLQGPENEFDPTDLSTDVANRQIVMPSAAPGRALFTLAGQGAKPDFSNARSGFGFE